MGSEYDDVNVALFAANDFRAQLTRLQHPDFPLAKGRIADREWVKATDGGAQPSWQIIIRDDGTEDTGLGTGDASLGISVLAGSKQNPAPAGDLARLVKRFIRAWPRVEVGNPVTAINSLTGPALVTEASTYARQYLSCTMSVLGVPS